jgi:Ca-activated chloride channel homolog
MLGGKETGFETVIDPAAASYRNGFVPRLWATRKVAALVDEIRQAGAEGLSTSDPRVKELVDAVVDLSTRYGILTEYTAFLAREDVPPMAMPEIRARVTDNLRDRAAGERTGAGGASQQLDLSAKSAAANAPAAGGYVVLSQTGQREERRAENIRQVADQTFYNRSNRWVDAALIDKDTLEPEETVEFGSEAYFMLAGELAKEGRQGVLAQGGEVYLVHKNRRVLVQAPPTP